MSARKRGRWYSLSSLAPTLAGLLTTALVYVFAPQLFGDLHNYPVILFAFLWIFGTMLGCAFGVVRHADAIARHLGEPYGTLVLTISVIVIEVSLMAAIILHGENNPTLARDAMFATLMIVLNGMVGTALLMGALRYWEQEYNLEGARAFLVVIASLAVFALIMPDLTKTEPDPSLSPFQAGLFAAITILFYAIFLAIQTMRHRAFFAEPVNGKGEAPAYLVAAQRARYRLAAIPRADAGAHACAHRGALDLSRHHRRFRHRASRSPGAARRHPHRHIWCCRRKA